MQVEFNDSIENDTSNLDILWSKENIVEIKIDRKERIINILKETTRIYLMLAKNYYME